MLGWSQEQLAQNAAISRQTIVDFERGLRLPITNNLVAIVAAFERAGIEFLADNGLRLKRR
ncbi:helix-turn-helix transcriptional regulator [Labrys miyagiensis]|uniref:helix-turn-helix transcriptional regulator n=1 Tax=Labrys miyagiensis TaxID=346912 RepID=UPI0024E13B28|nr:helix-turn-helix transcriptional regulator [Labrys miyagiensis]